MPFPCPRCSTDVPDNSRHCPYCSLPKPKGRFKDKTGHTQNHAVSATSTTDRVENRRPMPLRKPKRRPSAPVLVAAALAVVLCAGIYIFLVPLAFSNEAEPKTVLMALDKLRRMPSNEEGLTIDARLARELERLRRSGNLVAYQGWIVKPVKGTKTRVLLVFSYEQVGGIQHRAEWLADLDQSTFTPQNELAVSLSK